MQQSIILNDFSKGLNTELPAESLLFEATEAYNIRSKGGMLLARNDNLFYTEVPLKENVHSIGMYKKQTGEKTIFFGCGTKIYSEVIQQTKWWDNSWGYRCKISIINNSAQEGSKYLLTVNLPTTFSYAKCKAAGEDVRFIDSDGLTCLPYWIEQWGSITQKASIFVKVNIPANSVKVIYMYFGNPNAVAMSNRQGLFLIDDDFSTDPFLSGRMTKNVSNIYRLDWVEKTINNKVEQCITGGYIGGSGGVNCYALFKDSNYLNALINVRVFLSFRNEYQRCMTPSVFILRPEGFVDWETYIYGEGTSLNFVLSTDTADRVVIPLTGVALGEWYIIRVWWDGEKITTCLYPKTQLIGDNSAPIAECSLSSSNSVAVGIGGKWDKYSEYYNMNFLDDCIVSPYNSQIKIQNADVNGLIIIEENAPASQSPPNTEQPVVISANTWQSTNWDNYFIITNGIDNAWSYNDTDATPWRQWGDTYALNKKFKYLTEHKGRLIVAGDTSSPSRIYYSNISDQGLPAWKNPTDWQTAGQYNYEDITSKQNDIITGIVSPLFESICIFKTHSIVLLSGDAPSEWYERHLPYPFGCISPRSIVKYKDTVFFLSSIGVHSLSGASGIGELTFDKIQAESLTEIIKPSFLTSLHLETAIGAVYDNKYYLFFPDDNKTFIFDWRRKAWWQDINTSTYSAFVDTSLTDDPYGNFYIGKDNGQVFLYECSNTKDSNNLWKSGRFSTSYQSKIRSITAEYTGNFTVRIINENGEKVILSFPAGNETFKTKRINCSLVNKYFQVELSKITDRVKQVMLEVIPLRTR